jgi:hypothetical protein
MRGLPSPTITSAFLLAPSLDLYSATSAGKRGGSSFRFATGMTFGGLGETILACRHLADVVYRRSETEKRRHENKIRA